MRTCTCDGFVALQSCLRLCFFFCVLFMCLSGVLFSWLCSSVVLTVFLVVIVCEHHCVSGLDTVPCMSLCDKPLHNTHYVFTLY